jgi:ADP-ribose pyrophosphatase
VAQLPPDGPLPVTDPAWQVLRSETVLDSPWLRVRRQHVRVPNGQELPEYYLIDGPNVVVIMALNQSGDVILVDQYRHAIRRTLLELPAGLVEPNDANPATAVERELLEETGYQPGRLLPIGELFPSPARQSNMTHCFLALDCQPVARPLGDPTENISLRLMPLPDARVAALRGDLASQTSLACLFLGLERLGELRLR